MKRSPTFRLLPLAAALLLVPPAFGNALPDEKIPFNAAQIKNLGIALVAPKAVAKAAGDPLAAKVVASPDAEWVVTAPAGGVITRMLVAEGDEVPLGGLLAELRSADAPQMGAELVQAESAAQLARSEHDRDVQLHREGIIAQRRVQASEQALAQAESQLAAVRMRFKLMGISAQEASQGRLSLRAPASAVVLERLATPGQRLNEADPLLRLADAHKLMLELNVPVEVARFKVGDLITLADGRKATVKQTGWGASDANQTVRVRAALPSTVTDLRPGQWLIVRSEVIRTLSAWSVPATAMVRLNKVSVVFVREDTGFRAVPVSVLSSDGNTVTVEGALTTSDAIAATGAIAIKGAWMDHGGVE